MNSERLEALLWERVDGTISTGDLAALTAALTEGEEPLRLEREVVGLADRLADVRPVAPPERLRARIDEALAAATHAADHVKLQGTVARRRAWAESTPRWLPLAACLAVGIALGAILPLVGDLDVPESQVAGTMGAAAGLPVALDLGDGRGVVRIVRSPLETRIDLELETDEEVVLSIWQVGANLAVSGLDSADHSTTLSMTGGSVSLTTRGPGLRSLGIRGATPTAELRLEVTVGGAVRLEHRFAPVPEEGGS